MSPQHPPLSIKAGLPPGSLVYVGPPRDHSVGVTVIPVGEAEPVPRALSSPADLESLLVEKGLLWLHLDGLHETGWLEALGKRFGIDALVLEDVLNTHQRPKFEAHPDMLQFHLKSVKSADTGFNMEQVSVLAGKGWVLTIQEHSSNLLNPVRERLKRPQSRLRRGGSDLLMAAVLDVIVDGCFHAVEKLGEQLEHLEQRVHKDVDKNVMQEAYRLRSRLHELRRAFLPLREALGYTLQLDTRHVLPASRPYLRDVLDHVLQLIEQVETQREIVNQVVELHLSLVSLRSTEVMKVLTIIATIFIPLSFLAGVYGMNFDRSTGPLAMPELAWAWGYPAFWAICLTFVGGFVIWFRHKRWL